MKKIIATTLACAMMFSLAACNSRKPEQGQEQETTVPNIVETEVPLTEPTTTPETTANLASDFVKCKLDKITVTSKEDKEDKEEVAFYVPELQIKSSYADSINKEITAAYETHKAKFKGGESDPSLGTSYIAYLTKEGILSLVFTVYTEDTNYDFKIYNIDTKTGEKIENARLAQIAGVSDIRKAAMDALQNFFNKQGEYELKDYKVVSEKDEDYESGVKDVEDAFGEEYLNDKMQIGLTNEGKMFFLSKIGEASGTMYSWRLYGSDGSDLDDEDNPFWTGAKEDDGEEEVSFPTGGEKIITHTLTSPDSRQAVSEQTMRVLPADVSKLNDYLTYDLFGKAQADINYDGRGDVLGSSAVLVGTNSGNYTTQAEGLWNTNFLTPSWHPTSMWYDYNRDGQVDLMLQENYGSNYLYSYLPHAANAPTLSDRVDDDAIENLFGYFIRDNMGREIGRVVCPQRDFTHNGRYDVFEKNRDAQNQDVLYLRVQQEDGTYATQTSDMALYEFMNGEETYKRFAEDLNHDGFIDLVLMNPSALKVAYNRGGGVFDIQSIPFANDLGYDYYKPSLVDFNGDGYLDLLYVSGKAVYVMWNTTNTSYSVPVHLLDNAGDEISILDIDANGYPDIATTMTDPATKLHGLYIWFMGPNGVVIEGKFMDNVASSTYGTKGAYLACGESYLMSTYSYRLLPQNEDAAPAVPTGLTAQSTDDGLLIQWNDAADDHTPAALMRYNLAVRLQGSTTYLISPLNGANNGTMPLSDYRYISATQFLIPSSALTTGTYEIQLQALDMQQHFSDFTPILTVSYTRTNPFEMVEEACTNDEVLISYRGAVGQSSPSWTFDGGSIVSGNGYGPYTVTWNSGGVSLFFG